MIITLPDIAAAKLCHPGARKFFSRHGWSWQDFIRHGRPATDFLATGDAMAIRVVTVARAARGRE